MREAKSKKRVEFRKKLHLVVVDENHKCVETSKEKEDIYFIKQ